MDATETFPHATGPGRGRLTMGRRLACGWLALWLAGCAAVAPTADPAPLHTRLGQTVALSGRFDGPAKIADFVRVDGELVYLPDLPPAPRPPYGTAVVARGTLRHSEPPADACVPGPDCFEAVVPAYWYLEAARLEIDP